MAYRRVSYHLGKIDCLVELILLHTQKRVILDRAIVPRPNAWHAVFVETTYKYMTRVGQTSVSLVVGRKVLRNEMEQCTRTHIHVP